VDTNAVQVTADWIKSLTMPMEAHASAP
jgi:hypothetical protein